MQYNISNATKKNWERLNVKYTNDKLKERANKSNSKKRFIPLEYLSKKSNMNFILNLIDFIQSENIGTLEAIHSLGINLLYKNNIVEFNDYASYLVTQNYNKINEKLLHIDLPSDEHDILGLIYQSLQNEGNKNTKGSYYTPAEITEEMIRQFNFLKTDIIVDPACGSGSFLLSLPDTIDPNNIIGFDNDEIATTIATYNLLLRYPETNFKPNVFTLDFINDELPLELSDVDYIITNPPWGAKINSNDFSYLKTTESFSLFLAKSLDCLTYKSQISFLLPSSFLNVKKHRSIRKYVLDNYKIDSIFLYNNIFEGVVTDCLALTVSLEDNYNHDVSFYLQNKEKVKTPQSFFNITNTLNILPYSDIDQELLRKAFDNLYYTLEESSWALGIVTGNNKEKLSSVPEKNWEKIYTGKEITKYKLLNNDKYILYDRSNLQQVAPDSIYRASEKLVYKYISNDLVFAYDDTKSLFLNSANILIPNIPNMSIKTVLAFLNSNYMKFLYIKLFDELRTLKGNLMSLPFPEITSEQDKLLNNWVSEIIYEDKENSLKIQNKIYSIMNLSPEEINYIESII